MLNPNLSLTILLTALFVTTASAQSRVKLDIVAVTGDAAPDGNGIFQTFSSPSLNNTGKFAFDASLSNTNSGENDNAGVFQGEIGFGLEEIARKGEIAPDGDGVISFLARPALNDAGQTAFLVRIADSSIGSGDGFSILRGDVGGGLTPIVRVGADAPDANGTFDLSLNPDLNSDGQVLFRALLTGTSGGGSDNIGVFLQDDVVGLMQVAREGNAVLDGGEILSGIGVAAQNDAGQIVLVGRFADTENDETLFYRDSEGNLSALTQTGDVAPDGNGFLSKFGVLALNNAGQVAVVATLASTSGGESDGLGVFQVDGMGNTVQVARAGEPAPDGNGRFRRFTIHESQPDLITQNDQGEIVFYGLLTGTSGVASDSRGLFLHDKNGALMQIARGGDTVPGGNGQFIDFGSPAINNVGQIAFTSFLTDTAGESDDDRGIFYYDSDGLRELVREGNVLLGSEITSFGFVSNGNTIGDEQSGFNNHGQVAFRFQLADGREGIAIASIVPEPSTLLLALFGTAMLLAQRQKACGR